MRFFRSLFEKVPPGLAVILFLAIVSGLILSFKKITQLEDMEMWTPARNHLPAYVPFIKGWNKEHPDQQFSISHISSRALERRLLSGFFSGTPVANLTEIHIRTAHHSFAGPLDAIGFVDLTDRLKKEGLLDEINGPSFGPWTNRGRIFVLPHDVHPVLLAYRSDIVEEAGIDVSQIETWEDYFRMMKPLMADKDGDGYPDRYLLNIWDTTGAYIILLMQQAGGRLFDEEGKATMASDINVKTLATIVTWVSGPNRVGMEMISNSASDFSLMLDGVITGFFMPDWLIGNLKQKLPTIAGKLKVMPLPAWEPGGRRTAVSGGSGLGFPKAAPNFETAWELGKSLYFSEEIAIHLFETASIITPIKRFWDNPIYDRPDPFFSGQPIGRMLIDQAPYVPTRTSSPYLELATKHLVNAAGNLKRYANKNNIFTVEELLPEAKPQLKIAQEHVENQMARNIFLETTP
ncbi:MAG: extracellular solute-binding protein [Opitutaceae bacterium]|nr:extracellular solute-binding protein [Opitutaceae bacterium]